MAYRYYSRQRPIGPGTFPKPEGNEPKNIVNFDKREYIADYDIIAWGYLDYEHLLDKEEIKRYELEEAFDFTFEIFFSMSKSTKFKTTASNYAMAWRHLVDMLQSLFDPDENDDFIMKIEWLATEHKNITEN